MRFQLPIISFLGVILMATLAITIPGPADWIVASASNVYSYPGEDVRVDYLIGILAALVIGLGIAAFPSRREIKPALLFIWTFKVVFALGVMLIFENYYGLDSDGYFLPGWTPQTGLEFGQGTHNVRILCWILFKVIGPSFHAGKVVFSFISLLAICLVYRGAVLYLREESPRLLLILGLSPTVLFWSSLLGKDPVALFVAALYGHACMGWIVRAQKRYLIEAFLAMLLASYVRSYFIPIMAVPLCIVFLIQTKRPVVRAVFLPIVATAVLLSIRNFSIRTNVNSLDSFIAYEEKASAGWGAGQGARNTSSYALPDLPPLLYPLLIPFGIFSALFRPLPFEAHNPFAMVAAFDNTVLLGLSIYAYRRSRLRDFFDAKVIWAFSYVCLFSAMYGLGTPNMGALSRFKIQAWPHFICVALFLARKRLPSSSVPAPVPISPSAVSSARPA